MSLKNLPGIEKKLGKEGMARQLAEELTGSELNSFLLEVFRRKAKQVKPSELMRSYVTSRFTSPSDLDPMEIARMKTEILQHAATKGFRACELSPLMPFGTCSALAPVDQNNIVTALRGTEVISDITNALTLEACSVKKQGKSEQVDLCACERTVRAQSFDNPKFSAHFQLFAMISAGRDMGNFRFETDVIIRHLEFYIGFLESLIENPGLFIRLTPVADEDGDIGISQKIIPAVTKTFTRIPVKFEKAQKAFSYYRDLRAAIFLIHKGVEHMIIDGGFTDWSQKLLHNRKERLFTSGLGIEYLIKIIKDFNK